MKQSSSTVAPVAPIQNTNSVVVESLASADRPMQQVAPASSSAESGKKHKTGIIIGIIVAALVVIGGSIAAIVIAKNLSKKDPLIAAMTKMASGDAPENMLINGDIDISINDRYAIIPEVKISLQSAIRPKSLINSTNATITTTIKNSGEYSFDLGETYGAGDDIFFKVEGLTDAIEESEILHLLNIDENLPKVEDCGEEGCQPEELSTAGCPEGETCDQAESLTEDSVTIADSDQASSDEGAAMIISSVLDALELIDGEWVRVPIDAFSALPEGVIPTENASCASILVRNFSANSNNIAELYKNSPFLSSTDKDIQIASKQYPVRKLIIDAAAFADFVNSAQNTTIVKDIYTCLDIDDDVQLSEKDVADILAKLPDIYIEIDDNDRLARIYVENTVQSGFKCDCPDGAICDCVPPASIAVKLDFTFSYPSSLSIPEPLEYSDFSDIMQDISTSVNEV